jgi:hypothetical protein
MVGSCPHVTEMVAVKIAGGSVAVLALKKVFVQLPAVMARPNGGSMLSKVRSPSCADVMVTEYR